MFNFYLELKNGYNFLKNFDTNKTETENKTKIY